MIRLCSSPSETHELGVDEEPVIRLCFSPSETHELGDDEEPVIQ